MKIHHKSDFSDIKHLVYKKISRLVPNIIIHDNTNLEYDLALDSLDITALLIEIEEELNLDLNTISLEPIRNIYDITSSFQKIIQISNKK